MSAEKVAVTIDADVLDRARAAVAAGRAKSLSALVSEAVGEKVCRDELAQLLDAMDVEHGAPDRASRVWAKRAFRR
jgi:hypothetical protein